jgi:single-stranded DNA-binding protein
MKVFAKRITLGKDPELKETKNGNMLVTFSGAENHWTYNDGDFEEDGTTWYDFIAFGDTAMDIFTELQKGDSFSLGVNYNEKYDRYEADARIRDDVWKTDEGETRSRKKVTVFNFTKLEKKDNG